MNYIKNFYRRDKTNELRFQEHYYAVQTFLEDDELMKIWNIIEIAMNREGYDVSNCRTFNETIR